MRKLKLFLSLLMVMLLSVGNVWATEETVSWTASTGALGSAISSVNGTAQGTISTGTFSWNYTRTLKVLKSGKSDHIAMNNGYMQCGSSNAGEDLEFRTSSIPGTIKSITLMAGSKDTRHTGTISVGGTKYVNNGSLPAWANNAGDTWEGTGTSSGEIVITISCNGKQVPVYIQSITVVYEEGGSTPTCATPTFSPAAGTYASAQNVVLNCSTAGAAIHYTTDGSDPTTSSPTYSAAIPVNVTTTIKAFAVKSGLENSSVASATYTIVSIEHAGTESDPYTVADARNAIAVGGDLSNKHVAGIISQVDSYNSNYSSITYWISDDGETTSPQLEVYSGKGLNGAAFSAVTDLQVADEVTVKGTLKLYGEIYEFDKNNQLVSFNRPGSATPCATPTFSPAAGTYTEVQTVSISCETEGATIYYTTDGTNPTNESSVYSAAISVDKNMTIKAIAMKEGMENSFVATAAYTINLPEDETVQKTWDLSIDETATASEDALTWTATYVDMSFAKGTSTTNANNYYPGKSGENYTSTRTYKNSVITITPNGKEITSIVFTATTQGYGTALKNSTWSNASATSDAAVVTVTPENGTQAISATIGATCGFTAVCVHYKNPDATKPADPTFSLAAGTYTEVQTVSISCETEGATIYYTTDGTTPTSASTEYAASISVGEDMTIKAIAIKDDKQSNVVSAAYTINLPVSEEDQKTWDLTKDEMASASADELTWTATYVDMSITRGTNTAANNYCPPDNAETRVYTGATLTISPKGKQITTIVFETNGSTPFKNASWTNGAFSNEGNTVTITASAPGNVVAVFGANTRIYSVQVNYGPIDTSIPEAPTFSPAAGTYTSAQSVELACATEGATIYYTTDGTTPTSSSTEYTAAISVEEDMTIKAIAIKDEKVSPVATAAYVINLPLSTIQAVYDKAVAVGGTATEVNIAFNNWVVSGISTDNKNVYVTDGTKGFVIYDSEADHGFAVNDKLNGTVATSLKLYNKYADVIGLKANAEGLTVTHDGVITPVAATIADLGAVNTGAPIILNGVLFDGSVLSDGVNSITPYTTFYPDAVTSLESDKYYNITGIYVHFNNTKEIAPRSAADIEESILADPEISYDPASDEITKGEEGNWSAPTLINEHGVTIASYASDNEEVATVTDGGVISLAGGIGTAVITAHSNATSTYAAGNATYTITVNAPAPTPSGTTYRKVTATADITDGEYLIVYETTSVAFDGSLETLDAVGNTVDVTINEGEIAGTAAIDAAVFTIDVTAGSIKSASNKYIGVSSYSNGLSVSDDADAFENALSIDADGNAVIVITTTGGDMTLRYNSASNQLRFRYYKSGQQAIQLYKKVVVEPEPPVVNYTEVRNGLTEGWYYTMCLDKAVTAVKAGSIWKVLSKAANGNDVILEEVIGTLDAGRPYIFRAAASTLEVAYTGDAVLAPVTEGNNGLVGAFEQASIAQAATNYIIYNNALYFVNSPNVYVGEHRAYLDMTGVPAYNNEPQQGAPRRRVTMAVHGEQTTTGIDALNASETPVKVIIEGKLYIIRGEKMFNANGQLVK